MSKEKFEESEEDLLIGAVLKVGNELRLSDGKEHVEI